MSRVSHTTWKKCSLLICHCWSASVQLIKIFKTFSYSASNSLLGRPLYGSVWVPWVSRTNYCQVFTSPWYVVGRRCHQVPSEFDPRLEVGDSPGFMTSKFSCPTGTKSWFIQKEKQKKGEGKVSFPNTLSETLWASPLTLHGPYGSELPQGLSTSHWIPAILKISTRLFF